MNKKRIANVLTAVMCLGLIIPGMNPLLDKTGWKLEVHCEETANGYTCWTVFENGDK